jgi:hypothetical protein
MSSTIYHQSLLQPQPLPLQLFQTPTVGGRCMILPFSTLLHRIPQHLRKTGFAEHWSPCIVDALEELGPRIHLIDRLDLAHHLFWKLLIGEPVVLVQAGRYPNCSMC